MSAMELKAALFLSSKGSASCESTEVTGSTSNSWRYRVRVQIGEEEYKPFVPIGPGPHLCTTFTILVSRIKDQRQDEPRCEGKFYSIEACVEHLTGWGIPVADGWLPEEDWAVVSSDLDERDRVNQGGTW